MSDLTDDIICDQCGNQFKEHELHHETDVETKLDIPSSPCCHSDYEYVDSIKDRIGIGATNDRQNKSTL